MLDRFQGSPPDVVLIANYAVGTFVPDEGSFAEQWRAGIVQTIKGLPETSSVAVIADTPNMRTTPALCLSANLNNALECSYTRSEALHDRERELEATAALDANATYIDFSDYFCNRESCPAISGNILIYRDAHHLSVPYSAALSSQMMQALSPLLTK